MPVLQRSDATIHFDLHGSGFPVLLLAPGGLRSSAQYWKEPPGNYPDGVPWMDPREALAGRFTLVAMDQRNAGKSVAEVKPDHGWATFAADQLALMDHLGMDRFHIIGGCIGACYAYEIIKQSVGRVVSVVLQNPIGRWQNDDIWDLSIKQYAEIVRRRDPSIPQATIDAFGKNMFGSDFIFSVTRDFVKACPTPMYLQPGSDRPHPAKISAEIAELAPNIEVQEHWKGARYLSESISRVGAFLTKHTPS